MKQRCITKDRLEAFAKALRERDKSIGTREKYLRDVGCFAKWLNGAEITGENGAAWRDSLLKQGYAPASVNSMVAAVNQFLRHAGWEIYRIQPVKVQRKIFRDDRRELTREEYGRLVTAAHTLGRERLALLLETICVTGKAADDSPAGKIVPEAEKVRQSAKNRLRRDFSHQKRKEPVQETDLGGDEAAVQKGGGSAQQGVSPQPAAPVRPDLLPGLPGYRQAGGCVGPFQR